jgi:hypothetical protein
MLAGWLVTCMDVDAFSAATPRQVVCAAAISSNNNGNMAAARSTGTGDAAGPAPEIIGQAPDGAGWTPKVAGGRASETGLDGVCDYILYPLCVPDVSREFQDVSELLLLPG